MCFHLVKEQCLSAVLSWYLQVPLLLYKLLTEDSMAAASQPATVIPGTMQSSLLPDLSFDDSKCFIQFVRNNFLFIKISAICLSMGCSYINVCV